MKATATSSARTHRIIQALVFIVALSVSLAIATSAFAVVTFGSVSGTVLEADRGLPLGNIRVELLAPSDVGEPVLVHATTTDYTGAWSASVAPGQYLVRYSADSGGYAAKYHPDSATVADAELITVNNPVLARSLPLVMSARMERPATIAGDVVDMWDSSLIPDAAIVVHGLNEAGTWRQVRVGQADGAGHFVIEGLNPGTYTVSTVVGTCGTCRYLGPAGCLDDAQQLDIAPDEIIAVDFRVCTDVAAPLTGTDAGRYVPRSKTINLKASDDKSGVSATYYRLNGGKMVAGTSFSINRPGFNTIEFYSVDMAGNVESLRRQVVLVTNRPAPAPKR